MNNEQIKKEEGKCICHCHEEHNLPDGVQCRCIKNCIHCRPENFPSDQQPLKDEWKEQFVNDFCEWIPYRDTDLLYWKGIKEKNINLIPTPKTVIQWIEEIQLEQQKDFDARVDRFIKEAEAMKGYISNLAPDDEHHTVENYNIGITDTVALAKQILQGNE